MANYQFNGFGANMFLPFYGSDTIDAVIQKLENGQTDDGSIDPALTRIVIHTIGGLPSATARTAISRSVIMPTRRSFSPTGRLPASIFAIICAASRMLCVGLATMTSQLIASQTFIVGPPLVCGLLGRPCRSTGHYGDRLLAVRAKRFATDGNPEPPRQKSGIMIRQIEDVTVRPSRYEVANDQC